MCGERMAHHIVVGLDEFDFDVIEKVIDACDGTGDSNIVWMLVAER